MSVGCWAGHEGVSGGEAAEGTADTRGCVRSGGTRAAGESQLWRRGFQRSPRKGQLLKVGGKFAVGRGREGRGGWAPPPPPL